MGDTYQCPVSPDHTTIPRENMGGPDMWCVDCYAFRNQDTEAEIQ